MNRRQLLQRGDTLDTQPKLLTDPYRQQRQLLAPLLEGNWQQLEL